MVKKLITEDFNLKKVDYVSKEGKRSVFVMIDPKTSEDTFKYKDTLRKFNAIFHRGIMAWGWYVKGADDWQWEKYIIPCYEWLLSIANNGQGQRESSMEELITQVRFEDAIEELAYEASKSNVPDAKKVLDKLQEFKTSLSYLSSDELKAKLEPIIKFQQAQGHRFSFKNAIMIVIQDPEATMVKSKTGWEKMNRIVIDKSHPIILFRPNKEAMTPEQKQAFTQKFLGICGVKDIKELNPGQKEELRIQLNGGGEFKSSDRLFVPYQAFDIRFTQQMKNREELISPNQKTEFDWYDKSTDENEYIQILIKSCTKLIQDSGVQIEYVEPDRLHGALGVSTGGKILLSNQEVYTKNYLATMVHEYSHELLHQTYLRDSSKDDLAQFFIGRTQGRQLVEQQAEMSAWIVLKYYNLESNASLNYIASWGAKNEKDAVKVFDTVGKCASMIISKLGGYLETVGTELFGDNKF